MLESVVRLGARRPRRRRLPPSPGAHLQLRTMRPSLLDRRFLIEAAVIDQEDGTLAVRLGDYNLTQIAGLALDVPSLNQILDRMRHLCPR